VFTTLLLTERELTAHDAERFAHLHDPEPVKIHVVIPDHDDHSEFEEAVDDIARTDFRDALHDQDASKSQAELTSSAQAALNASVAALRGQGVADVDGELVTGDPVAGVEDIARQLDVDELVVLTEPHLIADFTRRDWASRLRHGLDKPVLHVVLGTDQVVS
jgi:nucleotide-binding universal stress UspA family protein